MAASTLEVLITGDSSKLTSALTKGAASTKSFESSVNKSTASVKSALGTVIPLGAAAAGAAVGAFAVKSVNAATQFDASFTQIAALTNTTSDQLGVMRQHVLDLAGETAQAPNDLAKAAYFLASAGLDATQQMETLDASAKAAAVGLGQAGDIARITANALNVYGDNGLRAADVTDTLVAAVREGSAEPDEFANALGRVLPIADKAGISFQQVAASLATMSNAGLDVDEGVTALRGTLQALISPTTQTQDALASIGLTVDDVVSSLQQDGLIATLRLLDKEARKNTDSTGEYNVVMRELVPNVRALTGVFNLTGQEADKVDAIFRSVTDSTGDLAKAFETTQESDAFRMKQALNDIAIAGQELASKVLPALAGGLGFVADHAETLLKILVAYGALRIVQFFRDLAVAQQAEAVAAGEAAAANTALAASTKGAALSGWTAQLAELNRTAGKATGTLFELPSAAAGMTGAVARLGNVIGNSGLPQILALVDAVSRARDEFVAFKAGDPAGVFNAVSGALSRFTGFQMPDFITDTDVDKVHATVDAITTSLTAAGLNADQQSKVIQDAMAAIGGSLNPDNVDEFAQAIQDSTNGLLTQEQQLDETRAAAEAYRLQQLHATQATDAFQKSFAPLQAKMDQFTRVGVDVNGFLDEFHTNLENADDPMQVIQTAFGDLQTAAADWRTETANSITGVGDVLSTLAGKAHASTADISAAFHQAAEDARAFSADLVTIAKTGGATGKELANALLAGGPAYAGLADKIAGASADTRRKLVSDFGTILAAGDTGASKLQHALVPVLDNIRDVLVAIAKEWGIDVPTGKVDKAHQHVDDLHAALESTVKQNWEPRVRVEAAQARAALHDVQAGLEALDGKTYQAVFQVHTEPRSPWPDEALAMHLFNPLQRQGAKKINGVWTVPLTVATHTDTSGLRDPVGHRNGSTPLGRAVDDIFRAVTKFATPREAVGVIRKVAQQGYDRTFIAKVVAQARNELGPVAAHNYARALKVLDDRTARNSRHQEDAIKAALRMLGDATKNGQRPGGGAGSTEPPAWWDNALRDVPRLPRGETDIDFDGPRRRRRHRNDRIAVSLGRQRFDRELGYEIDYGRGF